MKTAKSRLKSIKEEASKEDATIRWEFRARTAAEWPGVEKHLAGQPAPDPRSTTDQSGKTVDHYIAYRATCKDTQRELVAEIENLDSAYEGWVGFADEADWEGSNSSSVDEAADCAV